MNELTLPNCGGCDTCLLSSPTGTDAADPYRNRPTFRYGPDVPALSAFSDPTFATIPVTLGGIATFVPRNEVRYAEATGDYARLVTRTAHHLVRIPLGELSDRWSDFGFMRVHRRWLVQLAAISEVRTAQGTMQLRIGDNWLDVSRRRVAEVRAELVRRNAHSRSSAAPTGQGNVG